MSIWLEESGTAVILALMPLGVEHCAPGLQVQASPAVILALMPLGVEHPLSSATMTNGSAVILALMPLGVEHFRSAVDQVPRVACDPRIDAVRR